MSREKALLIGAQGPHSGQWIPISEVASWITRIESRPPIDMDGHVEIEVMDSNGDTKRQPADQIINGIAAKGHLRETLGPVSVSVYLEALGAVTAQSTGAH